MSGLALLAFCILLSAVASYFLKLGAMATVGKASLWVIATDPLVLLGACCYAAAFAGYLFVLQKVPLSLAQPTITAGVSVVTALLAVFMLREPMSLANWIGLALVCSGMYLLFLGKA